jgi:hypothetical protein
MWTANTGEDHPQEPAGGEGHPDQDFDHPQRGDEPGGVEEGDRAGHQPPHGRGAHHLEHPEPHEHDRQRHPQQERAGPDQEPPDVPVEDFQAAAKSGPA